MADYFAVHISQDVLLRIVRLTAPDEWVGRLVCRAFRRCTKSAPVDPQRAVTSVERYRWATHAVRLSKRLAAAAKRGDVRMLRWLIRNACPMGPTACSAAAEAGQLGALQLLRQAGCEWDGDVYVVAAFGNHVGVLEWADSHGCPSPPGERAALVDHPDVRPAARRWLCSKMPALARLRTRPTATN